MSSEQKLPALKRLFTRKKKPQFPPAHWAAAGAASALPAKESGEPAALAQPTVAPAESTDTQRKLSSVPDVKIADVSGTPRKEVDGASMATPPISSSASSPAPSPAPAEKTTFLRRLSRLGKRTPPTPAPALSTAPAPIDGLPTASDAPVPYPPPPPPPTEAEAVVVCEPTSTPPTPSQETPAEKDRTTSTLAQRISSALASLPALTGNGSSSPTSSGNFISRTLALANPEVLKLLSNPAVMNGRGGRSVWRALDDAGAEREGEEVMVCAPLGAESAEDVEVEEGEEVDVPDAAPKVEDAGQADTEGEKGDTQDTKGKGKEKTHKVRVFIPSKDKISFRATWWGFTLYLPPPVLITLNDKQLTAAKRAAMLFASLQWIIMKLPTRGLPPPALATVKVVRTLLPVLSALGAAISAAWAGIRSFDKGRGVKLSATWLMPLVLIPRAWEEADDFPLGMLGVREGEQVEYMGAAVAV